LNDFEKLYDTYFKYVYRYILSICKDVDLTEEITQETFFKALRKLHTFKGESSIRVWLCQIAKNTYFSYLKKNKRKCDFGTIEIPISESLESSIIREEGVSQIHKKIDKLDEPYKEVFSLRIFGELSFAEIGQIFAKSENWARVTYHRAKLKIKKSMEDDICE